jgi:hypothetical protein
MKRARAARAMASATRVVCDEEGDGDGYKSDGDEVGRRVTATRAMVTEGEQQSTSDGIDKGGRWRRGNHMTTMVGDNEQRERAADDDGSVKEGKGGKGDGEGNEVGGG